MRKSNQWPTTKVTLLSQIQEGRDDGAWRIFVDLYTPLIYQYCRRRGLQDADAKDVTQEVFARVSRAIQSFEYDPERGRFRSWLGLITHQQMLRYRRKLKAIGQGTGGGVGNVSAMNHATHSAAQWMRPGSMLSTRTSTAPQ